MQLPCCGRAGGAFISWQRARAWPTTLTSLQAAPTSLAAAVGAAISVASQVARSQAGVMPQRCRASMMGAMISWYKTTGIPGGLWCIKSSKWAKAGPGRLPTARESASPPERAPPRVPPAAPPLLTPAEVAAALEAPAAHVFRQASIDLEYARGATGRGAHSQLRHSPG